MPWVQCCSACSQSRARTRKWTQPVTKVRGEEEEEEEEEERLTVQAVEEIVKSIAEVMSRIKQLAQSQPEEAAHRRTREEVRGGRRGG
eukprot:739254-Hanusia_phi.AAC.2